MIDKIKNKFDQIKSDSLVKQSFITLILRVFGVVTLFGFTLFLTRNFPANIVGQFDFARIVLLLFGSIALLGTEQSVLFFTGKLKAINSFFVIKKLYIENLKILSLTSIVLIILFFILPKHLIGNFFNDSTLSTYNLVRACVIVLFFYSLTLYNTEFLRALDDLYFSELFRNTFKFFPVFFGTIILFFNPIYLEFLAYFFIYGFVLLAIITSLMIFNKLKKIKKENDSTVHISGKQIVKDSYSMGISSIIFFLILSIDVFLLKKYYGDTIVAYYSTAIKLMTFMTMIMLSISINISSNLSKLYLLNNKEELLQLVKKSNRIIFVINLFFGLFLLLFGYYILGFFGTNYNIAFSALVVLVIAQIICSYFGCIQAYMNMTSKGSVLKKVLLISLIINLVSNLYLIPKYAMLGAALSFFLSTIFWTLTSVFIVWKKDKILMF